MKYQDLVNRIRNEYLNARKSYSLISSERIQRGTSHTISSIIEDIIAEYLLNKLKNSTYAIWIDPQISIQGMKNRSNTRKFLFRPDLCIFDKNYKKIIAIFEVKMDLGFCRNTFIEYIEHRNEELLKINNKKGDCKKLLPDISISFEDNLFWNYIVISNKNINEKKYKEIENYFKINNNVGKLFNIVSNEHPNSKEENIVLIPNNEDFEKLDKYLESL